MEAHRPAACGPTPKSTPPRKGQVLSGAGWHPSVPSGRSGFVVAAVVVPSQQLPFEFLVILFDVVRGARVLRARVVRCDVGRVVVAWGVLVVDEALFGLG